MLYLKPLLFLLILVSNLNANTPTPHNKHANILGNHSFTITDFNIQVGGLPVQVNRTYSTLQRDSKLDFGYAWSIDYQNVKLQENIEPGIEWRAEQTFLLGKPLGYCFKPKQQHIVNISLPDGTTESFEYKFAKECDYGYTTGSFFNAPILKPLNGTEATLKAVNGSSAVAMTHIGELLDSHTLLLYNPSQYQLTMSNGMVYDLDEDFGIRKVTDLRGDTLIYNNDGIVSSRGESLSFERDSQNRIIKITDLSGKFMTYHYDANDDLDYVIDQLGQKTTYTYQEGHLLEEYYDPSGMRLTKNIYDESGRLIKTIDPDGNEVEFTHNIDGQEEIVKDKLGRTSLFVYDEDGNVLAQTNPMGETTTRTYDDKGNELTVTDALDHTATNTYDNRGNLLSTKDALGYSEVTTYNSNNAPTAITDKNDNSMSIVYDSYNSPTSFTTPSGAINRYTYDNFGNKLSATNEYGQTTTYEYDSKFGLGTVSSKGDLLKETQANGTIIEHTYDESSNLLSTTNTPSDGIATTTSNTYDAFNRLVTTTDERGHTSTNTYDARGNKTQTTDSQDRSTTYTYSPSNKIIKTNYSDGTTDSKSYDAMDNLLSETNTAQETTSYRYDDADRLVETRYPDGTTTKTEIDAAGRTISTTDQNANKTTYTYDDVGNQVSSTDALGNITRHTYDKQGNRLTVTDALGQTTSYEYNELNQRIKTTYADSTSIVENKNSSGLPISKTNEIGNQIEYAYDTTANIPLLNKVTLANGAVTNYSYDSTGKKRTQTDALSHTTTQTYTNLGELNTQTLPLGQTKSYNYDNYGRQTQINDYQNKAIKFIYDSNDRLVRAEYVDGSTTTYAYTPSGRLKSQTDAQGTITNTYDSMGRLKSQSNPNNETITYSYDGVGNITQIETPTQSVSKTYTKRNQLQSVTDNTGATNYTYDALGRQSTITYPNGTTTHYSYDSRNRITKIEHKDSSDSILQSFEYTLDNIGNRTQIIENTGRVTSYEYNSVNQLTKEIVINDPNNQNTITTYGYDLVGNLKTKTVNNTTTTYSYNANDQLIIQDAITFTYDSNGNMLRKSDSDTTTTYSYDDKNRLIKTITATDTIEYIYDANNNRVAKTTNSGTTTYLIDTNTAYAQLITESKDDGTTIEYTYGNDLINQSNSNQTLYYHTDALGSTRGLTDSNATLTDSYSYTPYGKLIKHNGTNQNSFLYTGEQLDSETDDYYLRARYYSPNSARFLTRDSYDGTAGNPVSQNHYLYGGGNPLTYVDPSGRMSIVSASFGAMAIGFMGAVALPRLPSMGRAAGRALDDLVDDALAGSTLSLSAMSYIYTMARLRSRSASETDDESHTPIQVYGSDYLPFHQGHISDAMSNFAAWRNGQTHPSPSILTYRGPNNRHNMKWMPLECNDGYVRDEYPYASTEEGGSKNRHQVSLRCLPSSESSDQGGFNSSFYGKSQMRAGDKFLVIPAGSITGFLDKQGVYHRYIPRRDR